MDADRLSQALAPILDQLITPALVLDLDAVDHNLAAAIARFGGPERWRPHLKTSKQAVIVTAMLAAGLRRFKVATLDELALLLRTCPEDLLPTIDVALAYPLQRSALAGALALLDARPVRLLILADSPTHLAALGRWLDALGRREPTPVLLDVDLGMNRTGSPPAIWRALAATPATLRLAGLHGYDGHLGWERRAEAHAGYAQLCDLAETLAARLTIDPADLELMTSGTHSYAHALAHPRLTGGPWQHRVSPGTIILSDGRSAAAAADIGLRQAAFVASRVISTGSARATLDAGSKAVTPDAHGEPSCAVLDHPELRPLTASEEHLPCAVDPGAPLPELGALTWLVPAHVCTTVNLHREALWIRDGQFVGSGPVGAAGHRAHAPDPRDLDRVD